VPVFYTLIAADHLAKVEDAEELPADTHAPAEPALGVA
jgi:hypothetical protein